MVKYLKNKHGKFAGSIGDGAHNVPTTAPTLPGHPGAQSEPLDAYDQTMLDGLRTNILTNDRGGELINVAATPTSNLPFATGLILEHVRTSNVEFNSGNTYLMPVGATGTWNNYPFIIGPGGEGYATTFALYPQGTDLLDSDAQPLTVTTTMYGGGVGDLAEDADKSLLDSMFRNSLRRLWHARPEIAEQFTYPGVTFPAPVKRKKFLGLF